MATALDPGAPGVGMKRRRMREPFLSQFRELVREGAGTLDFHDGQKGSELTEDRRGDDRILSRELARVAVHQRSICRLLERYVGPVDTVLDVGCGTGATTVAVALSEKLGARSVLGIDPNARSIAAARVRALGFDLAPNRITFETVVAGEAFPVEPESFDLVLCVSVLEYLGKPSARLLFAEQLLRAAKPGGTICLATPNPFLPFDYHTRRLLGDLRRTEGFPWASRPSEIRRMFAGHDVRFLRSEQLEHGLGRRGVPVASLGALLEPLGLLAHLLPWQKVLVKKSA